MKSAHSASLGMAFLATLLHCKAISTPIDSDYSVRSVTHFSDRRLNGHVTIQTLELDRLDRVDKISLRSINSHLHKSTGLFSKEASDCLSANPGSRWHYHLSFEKLVQSGKFISVILKKSGMCAGTPNFDKEVRVYSVRTGTHLQGRYLFKHLFPSSKDYHADSDAYLIRLDDEMVDRLIEDSMLTLGDFDEECIDHLRFSSYRLWVDSQNAIFYPEFNQGTWHCQREYIIKLSRD